MHECNHDSEITNMREDIKEIRNDVKSLLQFKWQIFGGVSVISFLAVSVISLLKAVQ